MTKYEKNKNETFGASITFNFDRIQTIEKEAKNKRMKIN